MGELVPLKDLRTGLSPRSGPFDLDHASRLSQVFDQLPPILVHRTTMKIVDGEHRKGAARQLQRTEISVEWFDGTENEARDEAVRRNTLHGLPLTAVDRKRAAQEVLARHSDWSDSRIAEHCGISHDAVRRLRPVQVTRVRNLNPRTGRDGKSYPATRGQATEAAHNYLDKHPDAPIREVAEQTGGSVGSAQRVKHRRENPQHFDAHRHTPATPPPPAEERPTLAVVPEPDRTEVSVGDLDIFVPHWRRDYEYAPSNAVRDFGYWMARKVGVPTPGIEFSYEAWLDGVDLDACPADHRRHAAHELQRVAAYYTQAAERLAHPTHLRSAP